MKPRRHLALFALLAFAHTATAQDITKADNTDALSMITSWDGGIVPGSTNTAVWDNTVTAANSVALDADLSWQGIKVTDPGGAVTVNKGTGANTLTIGSGGIDMSSATQNLILGSATAGSGFNVVVGANQSWSVGTGVALTVGQQGGTITMESTLTKTGGGSFNLGGSGATTLTGSGVLEINGGTFINNMQSGSSSAGRTGATTLTSGNLAISTTISMFGSGALNLNGGGIGSGTTVSRGIDNALTIGGDVGFGGTGFSSGQLTFNGDVNLQGGTRTLTSALGSQGARFNGVISNGGITMEGTGRITLANDTNTFTGGTTINSGLLATSLNALASSESVTIGNAGSLALGSNGTTTINNLSGVAGSLIRTDFNLAGSGARALSINQTTDGTYAGSYSQGSSRPISLIKEGSAMLTLTGTGTYSGTTTVNAGTLKIGGAGLLGNGTYAGAITNNATLHFDSTDNQTLSGTLSGTGTLLKSSTGNLVLTANSDYQGDITISGGTLQVGNNSIAGFIGNNATITNNAALVWHRSNITNVGNDITGTGTLTKLGDSTLNLIGDSDYTGATTVAAGTLLVNGSLGNTTTTVESGAILAGSGSIAGLVNIDGGGTLAPGNSIASFTVGNLSMAAGSVFDFEAQDASATGADLLVTGTLNLVGVTLDLSGADLANVAWNIGDKLTLISYTGSPITSGFTGFDDDTSYFFGANEWLFRYADTTAGNNFASEATGDNFVTLTVIPEPGTALLGGLGLLILLRRRRA